jgi:hypothetical protein
MAGVIAVCCVGRFTAAYPTGVCSAVVCISVAVAAVLLVGINHAPDLLAIEYLLSTWAAVPARLLSATRIDRLCAQRRMLQQIAR